MVTVFSAGSYTGGLRSESSNEAARSSREMRSISVRMLLAVSVSTSSNGPVPRTSWRSKSSKRLNSTSRRLLL